MPLAPEYDAFLLFCQGTSFPEPVDISQDSQVFNGLVANYSPPLVGEQTLQHAVDKIMDLYPNNASLGSPYGTGNNTFGFTSEWKRDAAISALNSALLSSFPYSSW